MSLLDMDIEVIDATIGISTIDLSNKRQTFEIIKYLIIYYLSYEIILIVVISLQVRKFANFKYTVLNRSKYSISFPQYATEHKLNYLQSTCRQVHH